MAWENVYVGRIGNGEKGLERRRTSVCLFFRKEAEIGKIVKRERGEAKESKLMDMF